jgi:hypothetical protein
MCDNRWKFTGTIKGRQSNVRGLSVQGLEELKQRPALVFELIQKSASKRLVLSDSPHESKYCLIQ